MSFITPEIVKSLRANDGGTFAFAQFVHSIVMPAAPFLVSVDNSVGVDNLNDSGYWVGIEPVYSDFPDRYLDDPSAPVSKQLNNAIDNFRYWKWADTFLGFWIKDGHWHVDEVRHVEERAAALEIGYNNKQEAIWDIKNKVAIPVPVATPQ